MIVNLVCLAIIAIKTDVVVTFLIKVQKVALGYLCALVFLICLFI